MKLRTFIILFFITLIVIFSIQNSEITEVKFLFWKITMSRVLVIVSSFSIGLVVSVLISIRGKLSSHKE